MDINFEGVDDIKVGLDALIATGDINELLDNQDLSYIDNNLSDQFGDDYINSVLDAAGYDYLLDD